jgi:putative ABC transport system permease protein
VTVGLARYDLAVGQDLRYALRLFARRPGVAGLAVSTLAVGIAASTIVFTLADAILWRPLPFREPDRIVSLRAVQSPGSPSMPRVPSAAISAWTAKGDVLEGVYAYSVEPAVITAEEPQSVKTCGVSPGLLTALGVLPASGRDFAPEDAAPGSPAVAIVSDELARTLALEVGGRKGTVVVDGTPRTIVGVMRPGSSVPVARVALWIPLPARATGTGRVTAMARLRRGVDLVKAQTFTEATSRGLVDDHGRRLPSLRLVPFLDKDPTTNTAFSILFGAVTTLFLIAIGNASNVLLAEAVRRDSEMALRAALGATRWRLARQALSESLLLSGAAALIAAGIAALVIPRVARAVPFLMTFQSLRPIVVDGRALMFSIVAAAGAGVISSLASIARGARRDVHTTLQGVASPTSSHARLRSAFTVAQLASTLALLMSAGLLANGFVRMARADRGFDPAGVAQFYIRLPQRWFPDKSATDGKLDELRRAAASLPEVTSATVSEGVPPELGFMSAEGLETSDGVLIGRSDDTVAFADVDDGFFRTLGIPILTGRGFDGTDRGDSQPTAVISRALASRLWPAKDALGRHLRLDGGDTWLTVVGIAGDVANGGADQPRGALAIYTPRAQQVKTPRVETLVVRTRPGSHPIVPLRSLVRRILPDAPIDGVETAYEAIADSNARVRFATGLMVALAAVAFALALVGVYGSFWCTVRQRTHEMGVRIALGASSSAILKMLLLSSGRLVLLGVAIGAPVALAGAGMLRSLLFEVSPYDPLTFGLVVFALGLAALVATYLPARAATRIDPLAALRHS